CNKRYATARDMALAIEAAASLAPSSRVGSWVEALAVGILSRRAAQMADIEREAYRIDGRETPFPTAPSVGSRVDRESSHVACIPSVPSGRCARAPTAGAQSLAADRLEPTVPTHFTPVASLGASTLNELDGDGRSATFSRTARRTLHRIAFTLTIAALSVVAVYGAMRFGARYMRVSDVFVAGPSPAEAPLEILSPPAVSAPGLPPQPSAADSEPPRAPKHRTMKPPAGSPSNSARTGGSIGSQTSVRPLSGPDAASATRSASSDGPSRSSCNPPFWYDADGNKRYLRHCADL
ncbi:MAG: hypothetical protein M3O46_22920, partial [Myxococcota bacterium]|nr:hypothetical protein [Myxococcota bacterium]